MPGLVILGLLSTVLECEAVTICESPNCDVNMESKNFDRKFSEPGIDIREWVSKVWRKHDEGKHGDTVETNVRCPVLTPASECPWGSCTSPGNGSVPLGDGSVLSGAWDQGLLHGSGSLARSDGAIVRGEYRHGCLTGLVTVREAGGALGVGYYVGGRLAPGPLWLLLPAGEGALYTQTEGGYGDLTRALFTGDSVVFVYPDWVTALKGQFVAATMLSAVEVTVIQHRLGRDGIMSLSCEESEDRKVIYRSDPSTESHLSSTPLLRDPYEAKTVYIQTSSIPGAGLGVFTLRPVEKNTIIGYFNGVHRHKDSVQPRQSVYLAEGGYTNEMLDIPTQFQSWSQYQASTGHLINHGKVGNVEYRDCTHPRFGHILCVATIQDIPAHTELLVEYSLTVDKHRVKTALHSALRLGRLLTGKSRAQIVRDMKPYLKVVSNMMEALSLEDLMKF